ncbi:MAG: mechanosensitive ion channel family protein, partial [Lutibacter sp.]
GLKVDFTKVPANKNYSDTSGYKIGHRFVLFPYQMPLIYVEKIGDNWYYSRETIANVNKLYKAVYPWYTDRLQNLIPKYGHNKILSLEIWQILGLIILAFISFIGFYLLKKPLFYVLKKIQYFIIRKSNSQINDALKKLARPIDLLLIAWFLTTFLPALQLNLDINKFLFLGLHIMVTVFWIYVFLKLVQVIMSIYAEFAKSTYNKLDDQLVPILHNFLTGLVVFLGALKLLTLFGVEPVTVIAGASIGGLAVALASQDTVKNLIGTVMIFVDKPFHIGDWIEAGEVIGTVETVGFRSTTVRAADTSVYQIPNSRLSEMVVNNKGLRAYRRYTTKLGLRYDTPISLIEAYVEGVRMIIKNHEATRNEAFNVEFSEFGDSALLILVNLYFTELDWNKEQHFKHQLHMQFLKLANDLGVGFAFPSSSLFIEQFPDKKNAMPKYNESPSHIDKILNQLNN